MKSVGAQLVIWIEKVFLLDYHEKNLFTNSSDSETSTRDINLKENSTDSLEQTQKSPKSRSKIHNGQQGSVTVSLFKLLFMRTNVRLQVCLYIEKRIDTCTLGTLKSTD